MAQFLISINGLETSPKESSLLKIAIFDIILSVTGDWRSWLARAVWDREVGGSSPLSPTNESARLVRAFSLVPDGARTVDSGASESRAEANS